MDTWVLMRGLTRESGHWGRFVGLLQDRFPAARIVALDLPGNGRLKELRSPSRIGAAMETCREQLRALGIAPPTTCSRCRWARWWQWTGQCSTRASSRAVC